MSINFFHLKNSIQLFTILILILSISNSYAAIYKWVDKNNNIHFSDLPPKEKQIKSKTDIEQILLEKDNVNTIQKSSNNQDTEINEKLKEYRKIKEHHNDEDITPFLNNLEQPNNKSKQPTNKSKQPDGEVKKLNNTSLKNKLIKKINNCEIAKNNLSKLNKFYQNNKKAEQPIIINKKNNKIRVLSKAEYNKEINSAKNQIEIFCS